MAAGLLCACVMGCGGSGNLERVSRAPTRVAIADNAPVLLPEVFLGVIPRAGKRELVARHSNPTNRTIRWATLRTSCDCLSVVAGKRTLEPSDDILSKIAYDGSERAEFVGNLAIEVTAVASDGAEVLRFYVRAEIVPEDELAFCAEAKP